MFLEKNAQEQVPQSQAPANIDENTPQEPQRKNSSNSVGTIASKNSNNSSNLNSAKSEHEYSTEDYFIHHFKTLVIQMKKEHSKTLGSFKTFNLTRKGTNSSNQQATDKNQDKMSQMLHMLVNNYLLQSVDIETYYLSRLALNTFIEGIEALIYFQPFSSLDGETFLQIWERAFNILEILLSKNLGDTEEETNLEICLLNFYQNYIMQTVTQQFDYQRTNSMIKVNYLLIGNLKETCETYFCSTSVRVKQGSLTLIKFILGLFGALFRFCRGGSVEDAHIFFCVNLFDENLVFILKKMALYWDKRSEKESLEIIDLFLGLFVEIIILNKSHQLNRIEMISFLLKKVIFERLKQLSTQKKCLAIEENFESFKKEFEVYQKFLEKIFDSDIVVFELYLHNDFLIIKQKLLFKLVKIVLEIYQRVKLDSLENFEVLVRHFPLDFLMNIFLPKTSNPVINNQLQQLTGSTGVSTKPLINLEFYYALHTKESQYIQFNEGNEKEQKDYFIKLSKFQIIFSQIDPEPFFLRYRKYKDKAIDSFIFSLYEKTSQANLVAVVEELMLFVKCKFIDWELIRDNIGLINAVSNNFKDRKILLSGLVTWLILLGSTIIEYDNYGEVGQVKTTLLARLKDYSSVEFDKLFSSEQRDTFRKDQKDSDKLVDEFPEKIEKAKSVTDRFHVHVNLLSKFVTKRYLYDKSILSVGTMLKFDSDQFFVKNLSTILECFYYNSQKFAELLLDNIIINERSTLNLRGLAGDKKSHLDFLSELLISWLGLENFYNKSTTPFFCWKMYIVTYYHSKTLYSKNSTNIKRFFVSAIQQHFSFFLVSLKSKFVLKIKEEFENSGTSKTLFSISKEDSLSEALTKFLTEEEQPLSVIEKNLPASEKNNLYKSGTSQEGRIQSDYFDNNTILENSLINVKFSDPNDLYFQVDCIIDELLTINVSESSLFLIGFMLGWSVELITNSIYWNVEQTKKNSFIENYLLVTTFIDKFFMIDINNQSLCVSSELNIKELEFFKRQNKVKYGRILLKSYGLFLAYKLSIKSACLWEYDKNYRINNLLNKSFEFFKNCAPEGLFMCIDLFVAQVKSFLICDTNFQSWDKLFNIGRELSQQLNILKIEGNEYMNGCQKMEEFLIILINNLKAQHNTFMKSDSFVNNLSEFQNFWFFQDLSENRQEKLFGHYQALATHLYEISKSNQLKIVFFIQSFCKNIDEINDTNQITLCYRIVQMFFMKIRFNELGKDEHILQFQSIQRLNETILGNTDEIDVIYPFFEFFSNIMISQHNQLVSNDAFGNLWIKYVNLTGQLVNKANLNTKSANQFSNINRLFCTFLKLLLSTKFLNKKKPSMLDMGFGNKDKNEGYNRWKNTIIIINEISPHLFKYITDFK